MVFNILGLSISLTNFGLTQAGYYDLTQKIKSSLENNTNYNTNSEFRREFGFRNLADDDDLLSNLANYGCWCMPLAGNYGKGPPVDEFDVLCKALHDGYQCAVQDAQLRGEVCVPNEVRYFDSYDGRDIDEIRSDCEAANVDACAQDASGNVDQGISPIDPDLDQYKRYNTDGSDGSFDPTATCVGSSSSSTVSEKSCCGFQPLRKSFRTESGEKECCEVVGRTYSIATNCCGDAGLQTVDTC